MEELLLETINKILVKKGKPLLERLDRNLNLQADLGFDSFDLAELTVRIEDKTGIDIFARKIVRTVGEVLEELQQ